MLPPPPPPQARLMARSEKAMKQSIAPRRLLVGTPSKNMPANVDPNAVVHQSWRLRLPNRFPTAECGPVVEIPIETTFVAVRLVDATPQLLSAGAPVQAVAPNVTGCVLDCIPTNRFTEPF